MFTANYWKALGLATVITLVFSLIRDTILSHYFHVALSTLASVAVNMVFIYCIFYLVQKYIIPPQDQVNQK